MISIDACLGRNFKSITQNVKYDKGNTLKDFSRVPNIDTTPLKCLKGY